MWTRYLSMNERLSLYEKAIAMQKEGLNYKEVATILKLSIGAVRGWLQDGLKPKSYSDCAIRNKPDLSPSSELAYLIGVKFGDGSLTKSTFKEPNKNHFEHHYCFSLWVKDKDFTEEFNRCVCKVLQKKQLYRMYHYFYRKKNQYTYIEEVWLVRAYSKLLYEFLRKGLEDLKPCIIPFPAEFIRGFADSEGGQYRYCYKGSDGYDRIKWQISMTNTNLEVLRFIKEVLLENFQINSFLYKRKTKFRRKTIYNLCITKRDDIKRFNSFIGFSIKRKIEPFINSSPSCLTSKSRRLLPQPKLL